MFTESTLMSIWNINICISPSLIATVCRICTTKIVFFSQRNFFTCTNYCYFSCAKGSNQGGGSSKDKHVGLQGVSIADRAVLSFLFDQFLFALFLLI